MTSDQLEPGRSSHDSKRLVTGSVTKSVPGSVTGSVIGSADEPATPSQRMAELLVRSSTGDESAFAELYALVSPRLYGIVLGVLRDPAQSEEVCQEALLDIWKLSGRFDPDRGSALSWMLVIGHRKAVDRVRSSEAARRRETRDLQLTPVVEVDVTSEQAQAAMAADGVRSALRKLSPVQREAIEMAYFGGYTHTEVADLLGLPLGTAKTRIRDGLRKLRDVLDPSLAV